ncbi:MAG: thioesterase family protein [Desulfobacterium sp.]|nr:thioesterase family protein [Desulfobacterium sp.]
MPCEDFNKEPVTEVAIRFQDCDPFGHLNNARYMDYFINVREDHLAEHYNLDIYERQKQFNTNWVVSKTKIAYLSPVFFRETVAIRTRLIHYKGDSLLMEGVMLDKNHKSLKSVIWIEFRHFDLAKGQRVEHPEELMERFDKMVKRGINIESFDERVKEINRLQKSKI